MSWKRDEQEERITYLEVELAAAKAENEALRGMLHKLAEQQAIPDDWWRKELAAIDAALAPKAQ